MEQNKINKKDIREKDIREKSIREKGIGIKEINITFHYFDSLPREAVYIREEVFVKEQGFKEEFDQWDEKVVHVVIYIGDKPAATGRLLPGKDIQTFLIGRVAVLKEYRQFHLGSEVVRRLEERAVSLGGKRIELSAQVRVQGFYEKMGYLSVGGIYPDEHVEHIKMIKNIKHDL